MKSGLMCISIITFLNIVALGEGVRSLHTWNSLFQSDARLQFQSDNSLVSAHNNYYDSITHDKYAHTKRAHPFIIKFPDHCGIECHDAVKALVGSGRHSVLSSSYAQVTVKSEEIIALQTQLGAEVVEDYVAMLPVLKVEKQTQALAQQDSVCDGSGAGGNVFQAVLAPQNSEDLTTVLDLLRGVVTDFATFFGADDAMVSLIVDPVGLQADIENVVSYEVKCVAGSTAIQATSLTSLVNSIASLPVVLWVEHREPFQSSNRWAAGLCQSGVAQSEPMFAAGLDGTGMTVGVSDTGIDMTHCMFHDANVPTPYDVVNLAHRKIVTYITFADKTDDEAGHGSHVTGTVGGRSNIRYGDFVKYDGNAEQAKIAFFDIGVTTSGSLTTPGNLNTGLLQPLYNAGARISTHSWGSSSNSYTTDARNVDAFMLANPEALVLFAAGNDGIERGVGSVGSPSTNKNGISVGASINSFDVMRAVMGPDIHRSLYSENSMAGFSSQGPTGDGRLKPDLAAPGWYTVSAMAIPGAENGHCDVKSLRGTSMASPTMAGNAALIQQYFLEGFYPSGIRTAADQFKPSGALLKAMLVHSGKSMETVTYDDGSQLSTGSYPSNIQGYGKIRLSDVLNFGESTNDPITLFVKGAANATSPMYAAISSTLKADRYYVVASAETTSIRVTMTYTDEVGSPGSSHPLINDLELRVFLGSDVHVPYYNSYSDVNNIEMVDIVSPCAGCNYTIQVRAVSLSAVQPYALVASGLITPFVFNTTSVSTTLDVTESIGPMTMRIIVALGIACLILGIFVVYLHKFDVPSKKRKDKTFEDEQREQAAALRYYEEQQRQRRNDNMQGAGGQAGTGTETPRSRREGGSAVAPSASGGGRGAGDDDGTVQSHRSNRSDSPSTAGKDPKKKKKKRRESEGNVELARQQPQQSSTTRR